MYSRCEWGFNKRGAAGLASAAMLLLSTNTPASQGILNGLPVSEVTVFKDGHIFVEHKGDLTINDEGKASLENLPQALFGTFLPFIESDEVVLRRVSSGRKEVSGNRSVNNMTELLTLNEGKAILLNVRYEDEGELHIVEGTIGSTLQNNDAFGQGTEKLLSVKTATGARLVPMNRIVSFEFKEEYVESREQTDYTSQLTFSFDPDDKNKTIEGGVTYAQAGVVWVPSYHIKMNEESGELEVLLQATITNHFADLNNIKMNLVVGVPKFLEGQGLDPIAIAGGLRHHTSFSGFRQTPDILVNTFSNAGISEVELYGSNSLSQATSDGSGLPSQEMYVFTVDGLSLAQSETAQVTLEKFTVPYEMEYDFVFAADSPNRLTQSGSKTDRGTDPGLSTETASTLLLMKNDRSFPFTTAPAMIYRDHQFVAQTQVKYTPIGSIGRVELPKSVDLRARNIDKVKERRFGAISNSGAEPSRIDMLGSIEVMNFKEIPVTVRVRREVHGIPEEISQDGEIKFLQDNTQRSSNGRVNGSGVFEWKLELKPGSKEILEYEWSH